MSALRVPVEVRQLDSRDPLSQMPLLRELVQRYLIFDACVDGERRVDLHPIVLSPAAHRSAVAAAESVYAAVSLAAARAHDDPVEQRHYDLDSGVLQLAAAARSRESGQARDLARDALARVDLLLGEDGVFRVASINADCPGGHNEALGLPVLAQAAGFLDGVDPTRIVPLLVERLVRHRPGAPGAVALLHGVDDAEDLQVCALLQRALRRRGARAVVCPPTALHLRRADGRLCVGAQPIAAIYRASPTASLSRLPNLPDLVDAVAQGAVRVVPSFSQIFTHSRLSLARAWAHLPTLPLAAAQALLRHLPECAALTNLNRDALRADRAGWVLRNEGAGTYIGAHMDEASWAAEVRAPQRRLAQRYVPQAPIQTPYGPRLLQLGVYLLDGRFCGYFAQVRPRPSLSTVSASARPVPVPVPVPVCLPVFVATAPAVAAPPPHTRQAPSSAASLGS